MGWGEVMGPSATQADLEHITRLEKENERLRYALQRIHDETHNGALGRGHTIARDALGLSHNCLVPSNR